MQIIDFFESDCQSYWLSQIGRCDWSAGRYLYQLLQNNELKKLVGENTRLLLLVEEHVALVSFCTYAQQDDIPAPSLTPWVGFVYTFPEYRGHRYIGELLQYAYNLARTDGCRNIYISTGETGLYEKYGYLFWKSMKDIHGADSRVYRIPVSNLDYSIRPVRQTELSVMEEFLYQALFVPEGGQPFPRSILSKPELRVYTEEFGSQKDDHCLVAETSDGKIVGAAWVRIMNDYGHVDDETPSLALSLLPEYRKNGIGTALLLKLLDVLEKKGYPGVSLSVQKANYAVRMYRAAGFLPVKEDSEEFIMVKSFRRE